MRFQLYINSWGEMVMDGDISVNRELTPKEHQLHSRWAAMAAEVKSGLEVVAGVDEDGEEWISLRIVLDGEGQAFINAVYEIAAEYDGDVESMMEDGTLFQIDYDVTDLPLAQFRQVVHNLDTLIRAREAVEVVGAETEEV